MEKQDGCPIEHVGHGGREDGGEGFGIGIWLAITQHDFGCYEISDPVTRFYWLPSRWSRVSG